jgi:hypothetical protein
MGPANVHPRVAAAARTLLPQVFTVVLLCLSGCATPSCASASYAPHGPNGGYRELDFGPDVFEVRYEWSSVPTRAFASDFALLRAAELARARNATVFCIEGLQVFNGQLDDWPESLDYAAHTIRTFTVAPPGREITRTGSVSAQLYACYEPLHAERWLRAEHGVAPDPMEPAAIEDEG